MPATSIHPMAVVEPGAELGTGVKIGPFCSVSSEAVIGDGVELISHVSILGATSLGQDSVVYPTAVLGAAPQNTKHTGGRTTLEIGRNTTIREGVTMHRGTDTSRGATTIGDNGNFLAYVHVAHDCKLGNNITMANLATLGGHVTIGDSVIFGGLSAVHQFCRIGHHAFIGGAAKVFGDVIPYGMLQGNNGSLRGLNIIGMRRSGMPRAEIQAARAAYKMIFDRDHPVSENLERARTAFGESPASGEIIDFLSNREKRHYSVPRIGRPSDDDADGED